MPIIRKMNKSNNNEILFSGSSALTINWDQWCCHLKPLTPKTCLPSLPPVNTALQINCVASPFWETELLSKLSTDRTCEYYCKCTHAMLEPAIVFLSESLSPLCCLCSTTVSGYIKHTYAHLFHWAYHSFFAEMSAAHQHPSVWDFSCTVSGAA